jgi:hypothetical protein
MQEGHAASLAKGRGDDMQARETGCAERALDLDGGVAGQAVRGEQGVEKAGAKKGEALPRAPPGTMIVPGPLRQKVNSGEPYG